MRLIAAPLAFALLATPAKADEISDTLEAALDAYRGGDIALAREELEYASQLLSQLKAAGLTGFLPAPLDGWERSEPETQSVPAGMLGGGVVAEAVYTKGTARVYLRLMADHPMVAAMAPVFGNAALMGSMGEIRRIQRQKLVVTAEGGVQSLIGGKVFVAIDGDAALEDKLSYFEALDIDELKAF